MNRLKKCAVLLTVCLMAVSSKAAAEVNVSFDCDEGTISFSGDTMYAGDFVNVKIYADEDVPELVMEGKSDSAKKYNFVISPVLETGAYNIAVRTYELLDKGSFVYVTTDDADSVTDVLNNADSKSDVEKLFKDEGTRCILQGVEYDYLKLKNKDALYAALMENAPYEGSYNEILKKIRAVGVLCGVYEAGSALDAKNTVDSAKDLLGVSEIDAYGLEDKAYVKADYTKKLYDEIRKMNIYSLTDFLETYREKAILCASKSLTSTDSIGTLLKDMDEEAEYSKFDSLSKSEKIKIGTELTYSESYSTIEALADAFNEKVIAASTVGTAGSLGGGGGFSGGASVNQVMEVETVKTEKAEFKDMSGYSWAAAAVNALRDIGVINGYDAETFGPGRYVTREEFVKMTVNAFKVNDSSAAPIFEDVKPDDWFYGSVSAACSAEIINGVSENRFGTGENITRQDAVSIIFRTLNYKGILLEVGETEFNDKDKIAGYALDAVSALENAGYISGNGDGSFAPQRFLSRAEAAQIIYNALWKGEK